MDHTLALAKQTDIKLATSERIDVSPVGIKFKAKLTDIEWLSLVVQSAELKTAATWMLIDLLNFGEQTYGSMYNQAEELTGYSYGHLANIKSLGRSIPIERRFPFPVSVSHHRVVQAMLPEEQEAWLQYAVDHNLSRDALKSAIDYAKSESDVMDVVLPDGATADPNLVKSLALRLARAHTKNKNELFRDALNELLVLLENEL